jgi:hypothetical protein
MLAEMLLSGGMLLPALEWPVLRTRLIRQACEYINFMNGDEILVCC